jgi:hypothetical protein
MMRPIRETQWAEGLNPRRQFRRLLRLVMAWYHPELYHRVLTYSGAYVNQQWPSNPDTPHGAWEFHEHRFPNTPAKPLRIWMEVGDRDNLSTRDNMHDWVLANENMAKVLAAKGYHYQFVFARNAGHTDRTVNNKPCPKLWNIYGRDSLSRARKIDSYYKILIFSSPAAVPCGAG